MPEILAFSAAKRSQITIRELAVVYFRLEGPELSPPSVKQKRSHIEPFVAAFGDREWDGVRRSELRAWIRDRLEWGSDHTRRAALGSIKRLFEWCSTDEPNPWIPSNPYRKLSWPDGEEQRSSTDAEFRASLRVSPATHRRAMLFMRETGCRPQEIETLEWPMVRCGDDPPICVIPHTRHKTGRKTRRPKEIMLSSVAVKLLHYLRRHKQWLLPEMEPEAVFHGQRGQRLTARQMSSHFCGVRRRAGLPKSCKLYGNRHAVGNKCQAAGADPGTIAKILGHTSTRTTQRYYLHADETRKATAAALERGRKEKL